MGTSGLDPYTAEKLLSESKKEYNALDKKKVFNEQSRLISKINKNIPTDIFSNFVPNYRNLATIYQIFNCEDVPVKTRVLLESNVLGVMIKKRALEGKKQKMVPVDNLVYKSFVKKFNSEYTDLLEEQQSLLNKYITSFADNGLEMKIFLNEELGRLRNEIKGCLLIKEVEEDKEMRQKVAKVLTLVEGFKETPIDKKMLNKILSIQKFVKETQN